MTLLGPFSLENQLSRSACQHLALLQIPHHDSACQVCPPVAELSLSEEIPGVEGSRGRQGGESGLQKKGISPLVQFLLK